VIERAACESAENRIQEKDVGPFDTLICHSFGTRIVIILNRRRAIETKVSARNLFRRVTSLLVFNKRVALTGADEKRK